MIRLRRRATTSLSKRFDIRYRVLNPLASCSRFSNLGVQLPNETLAVVDIGYRDVIYVRCKAEANCLHAGPNKDVSTIQVVQPEGYAPCPSKFRKSFGNCCVLCQNASVRQPSTTDKHTNKHSTQKRHHAANCNSSVVVARLKD